jgi:hypothetical protein
MAIITTQKKVSAAVRLVGASCVKSGPANNAYIFPSLSGLFEVGHALFEAGCILYPLTDYATKSGVTRQAVDNWIWRDGQRVALVFQKGTKKNLTFLVEFE